MLGLQSRGSKFGREIGARRCVVSKFTLLTHALHVESESFDEFSKQVDKECVVSETGFKLVPTEDELSQRFFFAAIFAIIEVADAVKVDDTVVVDDVEANVDEGDDDVAEVDDAVAFFP